MSLLRQVMMLSCWCLMHSVLGQETARSDIFPDTLPGGGLAVIGGSDAAVHAQALAADGQWLVHLLADDHAAAAKLWRRRPTRYSRLSPSVCAVSVCPLRHNPSTR